MDTAGSVHFRELPNSCGAEVRGSLKYGAHAAQLAAPMARLFGAQGMRQTHVQSYLKSLLELIQRGSLKRFGLSRFELSFSGLRNGYLTSNKYPV